MTRERPKLSVAATDPTATGQASKLPIAADPPPPVVQVEAPTPAPEEAPAAPRTVRKSRRRVSEDEPRGITVWVEPEVFVSLKSIGLMERLTMREVMTEAISDYLRKKKQLSIVSAPPPKA